LHRRLVRISPGSDAGEAPLRAIFERDLITNLTKAFAAALVAFLLPVSIEWVLDYACLHADSHACRILSAGAWYGASIGVVVAVVAACSCIGEAVDAVHTPDSLFGSACFENACAAAILGLLAVALTSRSVLLNYDRAGAWSTTVCTALLLGAGSLVYGIVIVEEPQLELSSFNYSLKGTVAHGFVLTALLWMARLTLELATNVGYTPGGSWLPHIIVLASVGLVACGASLAKPVSTVSTSRGKAALARAVVTVAVHVFATVLGIQHVLLCSCLTALATFQAIARAEEWLIAGAKRRIPSVR